MLKSAKIPWKSGKIDDLHETLFPLQICVSLPFLLNAIKPILKGKLLVTLAETTLKLNERKILSSDVNNIFKSLPHLDTQMALILRNKFFRTFWGSKSLLVLIANFGLSQQRLKNSPKRQLFELSCLWFTSAKAPSENEIGSYFGFFIWSVFNFWLLLMSG